MSSFYRLLYTIGFTPWEGGLAQQSVRKQIASMFDREEQDRQPPYGRALDVGCGSGIHAVELARRGWGVTGIDVVPRALRRARRRAEQSGVSLQLIHGDITQLHNYNVGSNFELIIDFGTVHGLSAHQRRQVGRQIDAVAASDGVMLMLAFAPGKRGLLPGGLSVEDIEQTYPGWRITERIPQEAELPAFLQRSGAAPHWYRLMRV